MRYSSRQPAVLPASCAALPSPPSPRVIATSGRAAPRARLRHLTSGPPAPHAVAVRTYLGCQRIFGMKVCLSCSSESRNSKHVFAIVLHIYFRARKAAVSTSRRAAGEEGVSTTTTTNKFFRVTYLLSCFLTHVAHHYRIYTAPYSRSAPLSRGGARVRRADSGGSQVVHTHTAYIHTYVRTYVHT